MEVREEFLAKKQQKCSNRISVQNSSAAKEIKCDQCEYVAAFEKGLRQHRNTRRFLGARKSQVDLWSRDGRGSFFFTGQGMANPKIYGAGRLMVLNLRG